ncbi:hypothetical protein CbuG_1648 [Coxiella burnetii CbuG_Q212]|uniref:Uncharacterized protein n=1 Tax=Coxiella burnetii (strain Dugway 5J108-111) TaxID=434922 RepID=B5XHI3_COXBN|nr:hypothetical protein CBUD_1720a [Coxiella burnetii Dugway 5J108-111]ACJ18931.1 hypothetical protein CbuG_1648 [Coxiella burnetii CbuG_Q212]
MKKIFSIFYPYFPFPFKKRDKSSKIRGNLRG